MAKDSLKCDINFDPALRKKVEIVDILIALIIVALFILSLFSYSFYKEELNETIILYGSIGLFVSVVFLELVPQFLSPYLSLLVSIPSLGVEKAIIISVLASIVGCILGFEVGRKYGWRFICPFFEEKTLRKILNFWGRYGKWFVLAAAFTPLPDVPLIYGALGMSRRDFIIYGVITKAISFILIGYAAYYGLFSF
jgi:uncharacterized membrane protein YdjX (TVP38/TMEM64 family)